VNTSSNTNGDGNKGSLSIVGLKGTFGSSTAQAVNEFTFTGPTTCSNGNAGFGFTVLPGGRAVHRFDSTGDLLFLEFTTATLCFDPTIPASLANATLTVISGTGRFTNATGVLEFTGTAQPLFEDAAGNYFGQQNGTITGTINLP
jgi:hypothetical protein